MPFCLLACSFHRDKIVVEGEQPKSNIAGIVDNGTVDHHSQQQPAQTPVIHSPGQSGTSVRVKIEEDSNKDDQLGDSSTTNPASAEPQEDSAANPAGEDMEDNPNNPAGEDPEEGNWTTNLVWVGMDELSPLYEEIKGKLANAKGANSDEKTFYGHLKHYLARKINRNDGCLLLSDYENIKTLKERFESTIEKLDNKGNDYDDICMYGGFIKGILKDCVKILPLNE